MMTEFPRTVATLHLQGEEAWKTFQSALFGMKDYEKYTRTAGSSFYVSGTLEKSPKGFFEHIHACADGKTGEVLASVVRGEGFGNPNYTIKFYNQEFAELANRKVGGVNFLPPVRKNEEKPRAIAGLD